MKTRFRKVWCSSCSTMQFAGECPHPQSAPRKVVPPFSERAASQTGADLWGMEFRRFRAEQKSRELILPPMTGWTEYKVDASGKNAPELFPLAAPPSSSTVNWDGLIEAIKERAA